MLDPTDETSRSTQVGNNFGLNMQHVSGGRLQVRGIGDQLGHGPAHRHRLVRRTGEMQRHLRRNPTPELAFQRQVEGRDDTDATLIRRLSEVGKRREIHRQDLTLAASLYA
ncbi:Uncharacterised protein [Mycobacteroides abscessus subsp. abscessus]|nr:Uncharacterised protein [Mycobacteroides abscessus subsp. abscessus]